MDVSDYYGKVKTQHKVCNIFKLYSIYKVYLSINYLWTIITAYSVSVRYSMTTLLLTRLSFNDSEEG